MKEQEQDQEPKHSIQLVARRTGLTPAVIRAWERRYGAIRPSRSETRRRLYSDEDVERLRLLRQATLGGRRIGAIAGFPVGKLRDLVEEDDAAARRVPVAISGNGAPASARAWVQACLDAIQSFDATELELALKGASLEMGTLELMDHMLIPFLEAVGERWRTGSLRVYQEHLAAQVIRSQLDALRAHDMRPDGPVLVVTTPAGQRHELGALMAAVTAASRGWQVTYLGPDLPAEEVASAALRCKARAVALSIVHPAGDPLIAQELTKLRSLLPDETALIAGGRAAESYRTDLEKLGALQPGSLRCLREELDNLAAG